MDPDTRLKLARRSKLQNPNIYIPNDISIPYGVNEEYTGMEPSGKGNFQAVKLQRPARTTVCSHSTRDMAAVHSIVSKRDSNGTQG